jgi:two-component system phosphate regulon sensor histidine kinase PhoR
VFGGLVEGVVVVDRTGKVVLVNDAAKAARARAHDERQPADGRAGRRSRWLAADPAARHRGARRPAADAELELFGRHVRASARATRRSGRDRRATTSPHARARVGAARVLSNAAHELRTPVTSIAGYSETLLAGAVDAETSKEFLQTIHRNAERIAGLVNDLVLLDTLGGRATVVGDRVPIELAQVVSDAARTAKGVTPDAQIDVDVKPGLPYPVHAMDSTTWSRT